MYSSTVMVATVDHSQIHCPTFPLPQALPPPLSYSAENDTELVLPADCPLLSLLVYSGHCCDSHLLQPLEVEMASQRSSVGSAAHALPAHPIPAQPGNLLLHLPPPMLDLVRQHIPLVEQLNECSHLYKSFPPLTIDTIRRTPLLLTEESVQRLLHSPRLLALLAQSTAVVLHVNTLPRTSRAWKFILSSPNGLVLFPRLVSFSFRLSAAVVEARQMARMEAGQAMPALADTPLSFLPLLPFLSARHSTLRSLHLVHSSPVLGEELAALLAPLTSLRSLYVATSLSMEQLPALIALPLDVLDLSGSELSAVGEMAQSRLSADSVAGSALLHSIRILRLPRPWIQLTTTWRDYLDALVTERVSSTQPHTLSVHHSLSGTALQQLMASPPSRSLSIRLSLSLSGTQVSVPQAAMSLLWTAGPRQLHLSCNCNDWTSREEMQPFLDYVRWHQPRIRSLTLTEHPRVEQVTNELLLAISQCTRLESLSLSTSANRPTWSGPPSDVQWTGQPQFLHLRTLTLSGLRGAQADVCRLLAACPSLVVCVLDLLELSVDMLRVLSSSCLLLAHLQLKVSDESALVTSPAETDQERLRPIVPFRSLTKLDVHYTAWSRTRPRRPTLSHDATVPRTRR